MGKTKVETKYVVFVEHCGSYECHLPDIERVKKAKEQGHILGCVVHEGDFYSRPSCALYYNDGGYSKENLKKAGYEIVSELKEIEVYEECKTLYQL